MTAREAPLSRGLVDDVAPFLRGALGIIFVGISAISTVLIASSDLRYFIGDSTTIAYLFDRTWYAIVFAIILFLGEIATAERSRMAYTVFLIPDVFYTVRGMYAGMARGFIVIIGGEKPTEMQQFEGQALALVVSIILGYVIAKYGEILLFGKRRKTTK